MPPGFHRVSGDGRDAICEPADDAWVVQALKQTPPATRPSTNPADIVERLANNRAILKARIAGDLSLTDLSPIDSLIDTKLIPQARRLAELNPPFFYMCTSATRLRELLRSGWTDPRFHYNRVAGEVEFDPDLRMSDERPMDDMIMPVIYAPDATPEKRSAVLSEMIRNNESSLVEAFTRRAQVLTQMSIIDFIHKQTFDPMKLKDDQMWLAFGTEAVLSTRYMRDSVGMSYDDLIQRMMLDNPRNPVKASSIDLLHPTDPKYMKPAYVPLYLDAYHVRSTRVINELIKKGGASAVSTTLNAIRANPPADGPALVKLIAVTTGVDLTNEINGPR